MTFSHGDSTFTVRSRDGPAESLQPRMKASEAGVEEPELSERRIRADLRFDIVEGTLPAARWACSYPSTEIRLEAFVAIKTVDARRKLPKPLSNGTV